MTHTKHRLHAARPLIAALAILAFVGVSMRQAGAVELIPSFGMTKSTDSNAGDARGFGGLALRAPLLPFLKVEGGIGYRQDSFGGGDLKVRQWPVTASLWATPFPMAYAGAGVGWYRTTLDFSDNTLVKDVTNEKIGVHVGGGLDIPIAPSLGLDVNGRYIFMQKDKSNVQLPTTFNPDFWTLGLGLAIKF